jgi:DNA-binding response OmpR family regulator
VATTAEPARVLVIVESSDLAAGLRSHLERKRYAVELVHDTARAVARAIEWQPQAIVLDVTGPDLDGFDVLRAIRRSRLATPIVVLAERASEKERALKLGANETVTKPLDVRELVTRIEALLPSKT